MNQVCRKRKEMPLTKIWMLAFKCTPNFLVALTGVVLLNYCALLTERAAQEKTSKLLKIINLFL